MQNVWVSDCTLSMSSESFFSYIMYMYIMVRKSLRRNDLYKRKNAAILDLYNHSSLKLLVQTCSSIHHVIQKTNESLFLLLIILRSNKYSLWFDMMSIMVQTNKFLHSSLKLRMVTNSSPYNMMNNYYHDIVCRIFFIFWSDRLLCREQLQ